VRRFQPSRRVLKTSWNSESWLSGGREETTHEACWSRRVPCGSERCWICSSGKEGSLFGRASESEDKVVCRKTEGGSLACGGGCSLHARIEAVAGDGSALDREAFELRRAGWASLGSLLARRMRWKEGERVSVPESESARASDAAERDVAMHFISVR
jgi:hypothetical protein